MSKLYFRYGAMNSGKSTALMQVAHNYHERGMKALIIKPSTDTKGGGHVVSRLGVERQVDFSVAQDCDICATIEQWQGANGAIDCLLVDEAQFLTAAQVDQLFEIAVLGGIPVICYGLRTDFKMQGFEGSQRLLLLAHSLEELKTICSCGKKALLNGRKVNNQFVFEGNQIAIDQIDAVEYQSLCPECYFRESRKSAQQEEFYL